MNGNTGRIGRLLHIAHKLTLAPGELGTADNKNDHRGKKRTARQIILPQHGS